MANKMTFTVDGSVLIMEREFKAPRELVFEAHSTAEHLSAWWGPRGWTLSACTVDFRPGGIWHYCMKCIDKNQGDFFGFESWGKAVYKEIVTSEKIVYTDYFSDAGGNEAEGMPASEIAVTFEQLEGNRTRMVSRARYESEEALKKVVEMGMEQGISETSDRLEEYLESQSK
ncbi:SRPBCC domain-containing protein [Paenibacillus pinihumi]|uniref:SRPBCC domain-containing protein n=1 Tax=Paenibacillus pinihumi TaxID=669462 RepID=UPI00048BE530|nr:SRPBCC domain-containing protein [Paenibacillus pinihumi]